MANDSREVVIKIINADKQVKATDSFNKSESKSETKYVSEDNSSSSIKRLAVYAGTQAIGNIKNLSTYSYGKYTQLTENYVAQNSVSVANGIYNGATSIISAIGTGVAVGGWVGAIVGAVIGTANLAKTTVENYASAYEQLDQQAYDKYYQGERYGLINNNRGTEN